MNGRIRRSRVFDAFPCHPQFGLEQEISSRPNFFMASSSERDALLHFFCRYMLWLPFGHSKTIRYAKLIPHYSTFGPCRLDGFEVPAYVIGNGVHPSASNGARVAGNEHKMFIMCILEGGNHFGSRSTEIPAHSGKEPPFPNL